MVLDCKAVLARAATLDNNRCSRFLLSVCTLLAEQDTVEGIKTRHPEVLSQMAKKQTLLVR